jgi:hypothetical protein
MLTHPQQASTVEPEFGTAQPQLVYQFVQLARHQIEPVETLQFPLFYKHSNFIDNPPPEQKGNDYLWHLAHISFSTLGQGEKHILIWAKKHSQL